MFVKTCCDKSSLFRNNCRCSVANSQSNYRSQFTCSVLSPTLFRQSFGKLEEETRVYKMEEESYGAFNKDKESNQGHLVNVDMFLEHIGEFGKMQIILQIMFCIMMLPATYQTLLLTFAANNPDWKCTGLSAECNNTNTIFNSSHDFYERRCKFENRSSWEFVQPKKFSIVTEVYFV